MKLYRVVKGGITVAAGEFGKMFVIDEVIDLDKVIAERTGVSITIADALGDLVMSHCEPQIPPIEAPRPPAQTSAHARRPSAVSEE